MTRFDAVVVVIGAGFAGVTAARELAARGLDVIVLEAQHRLGGRTQTTTLSDGELVELGGTYVGPLQPHMWTELTRYGLVDEVVAGGAAPEIELAEIDSGLCWVPASEASSRLRRLLGRFWSGSRAVMPDPIRVNVTAEGPGSDEYTIAQRLDALELKRADRRILERHFATATGTSLTDSSLLSVMRNWALAGHDALAYGESAFGYRLARGTKSLLDAMLQDADVDVRLGTAAVRVENTQDSVRVTTKDGRSLLCRGVVVATPVGAWSHIDFDPPLSELRQEASREGFQLRHVSKGYAVVSGEHRALHALPPQPHPFGMLLTQSVRSEDEQLLVYWGTELLGDPHDAAAVERALRTLLPNVRVAEVRAEVYDDRRPYVHGAWSVLRKGQLRRYLPHLSFLRAEGRIAFASADIAAGWAGSIDGAIETGIVAARQLRTVIEGARPGYGAPARTNERHAGD